MAQKLHFEITINAPREKVWSTMLNDPTYREWTAGFSPGGYYEGEWKTGSKMLFLAKDENGKPGGMSSVIKEVRPYEFVSIHHVGVVENGVENTSGEVTSSWGDALENYTFVDENVGTKLKVDMDSDEKYVEMFNQQWPVALQKLKELSEK